MEASIGTALVLGVIVFLIYRSGTMELTQTMTRSAVKVTDSATSVWEDKALEKHSRDFGKVKTKLEDTSIVRSSHEEVRDIFKKLKQQRSAAYTQSTGGQNESV